MRRYIHISLLILFGGLVLSGCQPPEPNTITPVDPNSKTLIMYGNLGGYYTQNIEAAGAAVAAGALIEGQKVVVYQEKTDGNEIYELVRDAKQSKGYRKSVLKKYTAGEVVTMNRDDMKKILGDICKLAPADHYGLALGVHGRGWLPASYNMRRNASPSIIDAWEFSENPQTRFIGAGNHTMDIVDFAYAVGDVDWDFIMFDVCLMSNIEALYEMRNLASYIVASPSEILMSGFPYEKIVASLFKKWTDLTAVAHLYASAYNEATISVIKTSELEKLALTVRAMRIDGYNVVDPVAKNIQYYEDMATHLFYDLDEYMKEWSDNDNLYKEFLAQLGKTVIYKECSDNIYSYMQGRPAYIPIHHYSGVTAFIPTAETNSLFSDYRETSWYKAVYED